MKRCDTCDSTEIYDTQEDLGIHDPILYWVDLDNTCRCSRCHEMIQSVLQEYEGEDE